MAKARLSSIEKQIARLQAQARAIQASQDKKKSKAVGQVRALMKKLGVSVADLGGGAKAEAARRGPVPGAKRKGGGKVAPKYQDPATGEKWTGRGRTPKWLAAYLAAGRSKEEFAIASAPSA